MVIFKMSVAMNERSWQSWEHDGLLKPQDVI